MAAGSVDWWSGWVGMGSGPSGGRSDLVGADLLPVVEGLTVAVKTEHQPVARAPVLDSDRAVVVTGDVGEAPDLCRFDDEPRALARDVVRTRGAKRLGAVGVLVYAWHAPTLA